MWVRGYTAAPDEGGWVGTQARAGTPPLVTHYLKNVVAHPSDGDAGNWGSQK